MELVLMHVVVGLAFGAATTLLLVGAGTVLMLAVFCGVWTPDADLLVVAAYSGWCYGMAPIAGFVAFPCGVLASLILRFVGQAATHGRLFSRGAGAADA